MIVSRRVRTWVSTAVVAALLTFGAAPAFSQQNSNNNSGPAIFSTTTVIVGVTIVGGGVGLMLIFLSGDDEKGDSESKASYIRSNATALQRGLTMGRGAAVRELATAYRIDPPDREAFAEMLHDRRERLVALTDRERLTPERAEAFFRTIRRGMQFHPDLRDDLRDIERTDG